MWTVKIWESYEGRDFTFEYGGCDPLYTFHFDVEFDARAFVREMRGMRYYPRIEENPMHFSSVGEALQMFEEMTQ